MPKDSPSLCLCCQHQPGGRRQACISEYTASFPDGPAVDPYTAATALRTLDSGAHGGVRTS